MKDPFFSGWMFGLGLVMALFTLIIIMQLVGGNPRDDSDPPGGRSGVKVVTDHKTGMQYLRTPGGGLTPRLDVDGEQIREGGK